MAAMSNSFKIARTTAPAKAGMRRDWLASVSGATLLLALALGPAGGQTTDAPLGTPVGTQVNGEACGEPECVDFVGKGGAYRKAVGANTESESAADDPSKASSSGAGFSISVDGERVAGDTPTPVDAERKTDLGLEAVDIQVKYDGLDQKPVLNVSTVDVRRSYRAGAPVDFLATTNYGDWLARKEVLIYPRFDRSFGKVDPIKVPVDQAGRANWVMPADGPDEYDYVLRVYDKDGRFDETVPLSLVRTQKDLARDIQDDRDLVAPGSGDDRTALRNIPVYGGAVTVYGRNVPPGYSVRALGEAVPVDADSAFVIQRILPPGDHVVDVAVFGDGKGKDGGLNFDREINIPANDWFYVGLADLTVGYRTGDKGIEEVRDQEYDKVYTKGRAAFYLKGKIKGQYLLTAAADSKGDDIENLFRGLDDKDARSFLRRINPEEYYPVYGDDSTAFEDAPTRGKFYVRLERGDSHVMWGNFKAKVSGSKFLRNERALYGANAVYRSQSKTSFGESRYELQGYAANADTIPTREVLAGTGGSAYFLKYQDIVIGSETISVQIRDPLSGRVIETRRLVAGKDYEIDHLQGVVLLRSPLSSQGAQTGATQGVGFRQYLVVQYERTPAIGEVDGMSYGGRAQGWLGDHVRLGATGMKEETGEADQKMVGADIVVRHSDTTYLEAEIAQTEGPGFGQLWSYDGGLTHGSRGAADPLRGRKARAYSVRGQVDLADVSQRMTGTVGGFYEQKEAGFSSLDYDAVADQRVWGAFANVALNERTTLKLDYEDYADDEAQSKREGSASIEYQIDEYWKASFGVRHVGIDSLRGETQDNRDIVWDGSRTDLGARLTYSPTDDTSAYVFGQGTVQRSGNLRRNDRVGVGAQTRLTDRIGIEGEVSYGTWGWGALAAVTYEPTADRNYYVGYRLEPKDEIGLSRIDRTFASDDGSIVLGMRHRYNDALSVFSEANTDIFGHHRSLATTYGVTYTPDERWTVTGGFEGGRVKDDTIGDRSGTDLSDFDRIAPSLGISYKDADRFTASLKAEARFEDSKDDTRDQTSYYFAGGVAVKVSENWRGLASFDAVVSESDQSSIRNGEYIEASLGAAYRPIDNDRFNGLFKYVYLQDVPGSEQVSAVSGTEDGPRQRSHIFSIDGIYDVNEYLSVGAKYGFRIGETAMREADANGDYTLWGPWRRNSAHLGVVRADFHVIRNWDVMAEARVLHVDTKGLGSTTDFGAVAAVYRHFGDNMKAGIGYNFGQFSDDLRDQTLDDQGVFFNVIGKF